MYNVYTKVQRYQNKRAAPDWRGECVSESGLLRHHNVADGLGDHQEAAGEQLLLERHRVSAGLQHNVHQLLHLQPGEEPLERARVAPPSAADLSHGFPLVRQPTDDIVLMALALEKVFLQKVAAMVPKEEEISADVATGRGETSTAPGNDARHYVEAGKIFLLALMALFSYCSQFRI